MPILQHNLTPEFPVRVVDTSLKPCPHPEHITTLNHLQWLRIHKEISPAFRLHAFPGRPPHIPAATGLRSLPVRVIAVAQSWWSSRTCIYVFKALIPSSLMKTWFVPFCWKCRQKKTLLNKTRDQRGSQACEPCSPNFHEVLTPWDLSTDDLEGGF